MWVISLGMGIIKSQKNQRKYGELHENSNGKMESEISHVIAITMVFSGVLEFLGLVYRPLRIGRDLLFIHIVFTGKGYGVPFYLNT